VFVEAARPSKAMVAYEKALQWQELFNLALCEKIFEEDLCTMAYRVAGNLSAFLMIG
jgi:elongator complex protein 1